jgi:hypothetical protein
MEKQAMFNTAHSSLRMVVEQALLKGRFQQIQYVEILDATENVNIIFSA